MQQYHYFRNEATLPLCDDENRSVLWRIGALELSSFFYLQVLLYK
jgi:hypothetical protein